PARREVGVLPGLRAGVVNSGMRRTFIVLALLAAAGAARAQDGKDQPRAIDPGIASYNAGVLRIEREAKLRKDPTPEARPRAERSAEMQRKRAAAQAQRCQAQASAASGGKPPALIAGETQAECRKRLGTKLADIKRRPDGVGSLSGLEQMQQREAEQK